MIFSKTTTMAAATLLAVLFLGASTTYAAPVPQSNVDGTLYTVGKVIGTTAGGTLEAVAPSVVDGGLDGDRAVQTSKGPHYSPGNGLVKILEYDVGHTAGTAFSSTAPGSLRDGTVDGVKEATGKD
jgi:hypothetical protein